jgi:hypothetical protein
MASEVYSDGGMSDPKRRILTSDWELLTYWLLATTSGWLLGWLLLPAVALVTAGVGAGIMQWLVLYRRIPKAWRWALVTAVGWLAGVAIMLAVVLPGLGVLSGAVLGTATGTAQWLLLRRQVNWAGWWVPVSALAWALGISLAPSPELISLRRIVLSGTMPAVITGTVLALLLQVPKPPEGETPEGE